MQMSIQSINISNIALLSKAIGEKNENQMKLITGNSIIITFFISIITILFVYFIRTIFPEVFNVDKVCVTYITVRLIGFIQSSIVTVLTGHQRTIGKQGLIMILRIVAVIFNLIFDLLVIKLKSTVKYKLSKDILNQIFSLFKWNCIERIVSRIDKFIFNILVSRIGL